MTTSSREKNLEEAYVNLPLNKDEMEGLILEYILEDTNTEGLDRCLVGRFVTNKKVNFMAMQDTLASIYRPVKGVFMEETNRMNMFLFKFFHDRDMQRVLEDGPWTLNQQVLLIKKFNLDEQLKDVKLSELSMSVQIYDVPIGYKSKFILKSIGNFVGRIGHTEKFCEDMFDNPQAKEVTHYDSSLRAPSRGHGASKENQWLRGANGAALIPVKLNNKEEDGGGVETHRQEVSENCASGDHNSRKLGISEITGKISGGDQVVTVIEPKNMSISNERRDINIIGKEIAGLLISDPKRRRVDGVEESGPITDNAVEDIAMKEANMSESENQKSLLGADLVDQERPSFIFLCETKDSKGRLERVRRELRFDGMLTVDPQGRSGGLTLMWKEKDQVKLRSISRNHIDVEVCSENKDMWRLTGIYGEPDQAQRRKTWDFLRNLARDSNLPRCAIGDMNNVTSQLDKKGGALYPDRLIEGFNEVLAETGLIDMELVGHQFTWEKGRGINGWMEIHLDRALIYGEWLHLFPFAKLYNLEVTYQGVDADSFGRWLESVFEKSKKEEHAEIVSLCWAIWNAINQFVWDNKKSSVDGVLTSMRQYLADYSRAKKFSTQALYQFIEHGDGAQVWVRPKNGAVKVTVDAAIFTESSSYGIGMLARNDKGEVIYGRSESYQGNVCAEFAEAMAVKEALSWCKLNKWQETVIESDFLSVVQVVRSSIKMRSPFGHIIRECREILKELNIELFYIKRSANEAAHVLARESSSFPGRVFDGRSVSISLESIMLNDLRN
ncbi:hypothetical protein AgCh_008304 [Apium graveolens]